MLTLEREAARSVRHDLSVEREDILFWNSAPDVVEIEFTVRNDGPDRSPPTEATVEAAPLGAFVAWRPLGRVPVPAIDPGGEAVIRTRAACDPPPTGARPKRLNPARLLTALDLFDRRGRTASVRGVLGKLPADPLRAMFRGGVHWAGNLNVFLGGKATERHTARSLRVRPGCLNVALFCVGIGGDAYRFHLDGEVDAWNARLYESGLVWSGRDKAIDTGLPLGEWVSGAHLILVELHVEPPAGCAAGKLDVRVQQKSTGREAVVEFGFDPDAEGPGCYTV
jgi:hypothetical protein